MISTNIIKRHTAYCTRENNYQKTSHPDNHKSRTKIRTTVDFTILVKIVDYIDPKKNTNQRTTHGRISTCCVGGCRRKSRIFETMGKSSIRNITTDFPIDFTIQITRTLPRLIHAHHCAFLLAHIHSVIAKIVVRIESEIVTVSVIAITTSLLAHTVI